MMVNKKCYSYRQQVLAEWRGLAEPILLSEFLSAEEIVETVLKKYKFNLRFTEHEISMIWPEVVGEFLARHSQPQSLSNGILSIRVLESSVRYELNRFWKERIIDNLKSKLGKNLILTHIIFTL